MAAGNGGGTLWRRRTQIVAAEGSNGENSGRKGRVVEGWWRAVVGLRASEEKCRGRK